jgi:Zn-dependent peptidase ImmA (M78 family)
MSVDGTAVLSYSPLKNHHLTHIVIAHEIGHLLLHIFLSGDSLRFKKRLSLINEIEADYFSERVLLRKYEIYAKQYSVEKLKNEFVLSPCEIADTIKKQHPNYDPRRLK